MYFLPRIALVCATVFLVSCKSNEPDAAVEVLRQASEETQEKWFCQMAKDDPDAWDCVQDNDLAENPVPDRIPQPTLESEQPPPTSSSNQTETKVNKGSLRPSEDSLPSPPGQASSTPTSESSVPLYKQLAYHPNQDIEFDNLPGNYYTIQLLALSDQQALEDFVASTPLDSFSAAEVEKDGSLFYVLLLGVYTDKVIADRVARNLPTILNDLNPWVRRLESLQDAMNRAKLWHQ